MISRLVSIDYKTFCCMPQVANTQTAEKDAKHIEPLTKQQMQDFYAHYFSVSSPHRAKISVHLIAQAKPKQPSADEQEQQTLATFASLLAAEGITPDSEKLQSLTSSLESALDSPAKDKTAAYLDALFKHLTADDMDLPKEKVNKILDDARAALGVAEVEEKLANPNVLEDASMECQLGTGPVIIEDVRAFKAGLRLSKGLKPVKDLSEYMDEGAKL